MKTREEALEYGLSFPDTYTEMPFHDPGWQLVRVKGSKKAFLCTYEKDEMCIRDRLTPTATPMTSGPSYVPVIIP